MGTGKRIALVSGFWGQNIGNAFFNLGGKWVLEQAAPDSAVDFIQDQPGYRTFNRKRKGNPPRDVGLLKHLCADVIVLQGPMLTVTFEKLWRETFERLRARGTRIVLLSAALFTYDGREVAAARSFLRRFPPDIVVTRDHDTFEAIRDLCPVIYDGIDSAFFAPKVYRPFQLDLDPYIAVTFDRYPEPEFVVRETPAAAEGTDTCQQFDALGLHWQARTPRLPQALANRGQWQAYIGALLDRRQLPTRLGPFAVVRPEHRFNPHLGWKIYKHPNGIASDEPFTYFTVYAGAELTLSDRVHACVATLAFGRPAMLFSPTPRQALFERLGLGDIRQRPVELDAATLEAERQAEVAFLRAAMADL
ncbi:MAG: polysaccharide pyruvyl transferase family protein [Hyphomicrobiales bacterium]